MKPKRFFQINCATLDARNVQESTLAAYDKIIANCATLVTTPESRALLDQYGVTINTASVISVPAGGSVSTINGCAEIKPGQALPAEGSLLLVNGTLDVAPGGEEALRRYAAIQVNGSVECPESLAGLLMSIATVNGSLDTYPDGCIRLSPVTVLDHTFRLRARKDGHYYAEKRIVALDGDIGFDKLAEKNVRFTTSELLVSEGNAEAAVPLCNEEAKITVLPDGCVYVKGGETLSKTMLRLNGGKVRMNTSTLDSGAPQLRAGGKLFVNGSLTIGRESAALLERVSFLRVTGTLYVYRPLADAVLALDVTSKDLRLIGGRVLRDKDEVTVDRAVLEQAEDGLSVINCNEVSFAPDISLDLLRERLVSVSGCGYVTVADAAQRAMVEAVTAEVDELTLASAGQEDGGVSLGKLAPFAALLGVDPKGLTPADIAEIMRGSKFVSAASYTL